MEETTLAWLAGLIDGEGSVMLIKRAPSGRSIQYRPVVSVYNTDHRLMVALMRKTGVVRVYAHTRTPKENHKKVSYSWRLASTDISTLMPQVRPWLVLKGEQTDLLLEAIAIKQRLTAFVGEEWMTMDAVALATARLAEIHEEIRALNTRGREGWKWETSP